VRQAISWSRSQKARAGYGSAKAVLSVKACHLLQLKSGGYMDEWDDGYSEGFADCGRIGLIVVVLVIVCTVLVMR
jgi:hypothetical protein